MQKIIYQKCVYDGLFDGPMIESSIKEFEQHLEIEPREQKYENMTFEHLKTASEVFIYLNHCPSKMRPWLKFYKDLIQNQSPDQIILTLNRIINDRTPKPDYLTIGAQKLFTRIISLLYLKDNKVMKTFIPGKINQELKQTTEGIFKLK